MNKYLLKELEECGVWSEELKAEIMARNGSIQGIEKIPLDIQKRYKTGWEIKQRVLIDMAAARGAFICQSQSLNLFVADANYAKLTSMHFHAWKQGLKTGCYYLRTKAPVMAQKFTIDPRFAGSSSNAVQHVEENDESDDETSSTTSDEDDLERKAAEFAALVAQAKAAQENGEECLMCGS